jgi:AcrR family transcriptional regulator
VLPLVVEHGAAVTTSQIARAAGIGEATIFRAFTDKDELVDACVAEALRPDRVIDAIAAIPLDLPLAERLAEAASAMAAHVARMGALMGALHGSGYRRGRKPREGKRESALALHEAVADLFEPERDKLRLGPEQLAVVFTNMLMIRGRPVSENTPAITDLVDLLLNGALV